MKLSPTYTTVTPLSKFLAVFFFILFNVLGFYFGTYYQHIEQTRQYLRIEKAKLGEKTNLTQPNDESKWETYETTITPTQQEGQKCVVYYDRNSQQIPACATCGNNICETYETCTPQRESDPRVPIEDCGILYCPKDCDK